MSIVCVGQGSRSLFSRFCVALALSCFRSMQGLQSCQHVARADAVDTDASMCPLHSKTRSQMSHGCLCSIVRCLRLRHIDNGARHRANHNHTTLCLALHQMPSNLATEKVCPVNVHAPKLPEPIWWVCDSVEILSETGRCDQVVDLAMVLDNFGDRGFDRLIVRDIAEMRSDLGNTIIALVRTPNGKPRRTFQLQGSPPESASSVRWPDVVPRPL